MRKKTQKPRTKEAKKVFGPPVKVQENGKKTLEDLKSGQQRVCVEVI